MATGQTMDISAFNAFSKEVFPYGSEYWGQYDRKTPAMDLIESSNKIPFDGRVSSDGKYIVVPAMTDGHANPAVPSGGEYAGLPAAGRTEQDQIQYNLSRHTQAMEITGEVIDRMIGGEASVQDALKMQMREQPMEARKELNRVLHGDGSGAIFVPTAIASGNTITVSSTARLKVGTELVIRGDTSGTLYTGQTSGTALKVSSITNSTTFVVTDEDGAAVSLTNNASLTGYTGYRYDSQGRAINGFAIMCSQANPTNWGSATAYYGNINRSTETWWQSGSRVNASSGTISVQNHFQVLIDNLRSVADEYLPMTTDGVTWYAFTRRQNARILGNALKADQRTSPNYMTLKGGWKGIEYEGAVIVIDNDATASAVRFIHPGSVKRFVPKPWFWDDRTGSIWQRVAASDGRDSDVFKAYMYTRQQLISVRNITMGEIYGTAATS